MQHGAVKQIKLQYPLEFAGKIIEEITLRRLKAKHLKGFHVSAGGAFNMDALLPIIAASSNLEIGIIEELDAVDYMTLTQEVSDFLLPSPQTGETV